MNIAYHNTATTVTVILTQKTDGRPKTGVVPANVTLHYRKQGGTPVAQNPVAISEVNAVTMPGMYEISFTASEMDTLGEFVAVVTEANPAADIEFAYISLKIVPTVQDEIITPMMVAVNASLLGVENNLDLAITASTTTLQADLDDIKGAGFDTTTDSLEAIRDQVDTFGIKLDDIISMTKRVLGLSNENYQITGQVYNTEGQLTKAVINLYASETDLSNGTPIMESYDLKALYHPVGHSDEGKLYNYTIAKRP